jgi:hypothetical protein
MLGFLSAERVGDMV